MRSTNYITKSAVAVRDRKCKILASKVGKRITDFAGDGNMYVYFTVTPIPCQFSGEWFNNY